MIILDTETTTFKKGNPFARKNKLCYLGVMQPGQFVSVGDATLFPIVKPSLDDCSLLGGFNIKFDLHWLRRTYGWTPSKHTRIWDCQLAHFLLSAQGSPFPSLEEVRNHYKLTRQDVKLSVEYWARGVDTPDIPQDIILKDLQNDLLDTYAIYREQLREFANHPKLFTLFKLHCMDLLVLSEMEWNGLTFDEKESLKRAEQLKRDITEIEERLQLAAPGVPINWDSPEHISALLYGGTIRENRKVLAGYVKSGLRIGQPKYKHEEIRHELPRLTEPMDGTALKKDGYFSTDESILRQLNGAKSIREDLLERSKLSKELDYMQGLPALRAEMDWDEGKLHTQFNQCVAATGRLSSSKPNVQNLTDGILQLTQSLWNT